MSLSALKWVFDTPIRPASSKLVMIALADCANDEWLCWPSSAHVQSVTSLDERTITDALKRLVEGGFIIDTGRRAGGTGRVRIWRLNGHPDAADSHYTFTLTRMDTGESVMGVRSCTGSPDDDTLFMGDGAWPQAADRDGAILTKTILGRFASRAEAEVDLAHRQKSGDASRDNTPENGGVEIPPKLGGEYPQKWGVNTPKIGGRNLPVTSHEPSKRSEPAVAGFPPGLPDSHRTPEFLASWQAWEKHRRERRNPLTPTAISRQVAKLAALTVSHAIATLDRSCENGWTGLFPESAKPQEASGFIRGRKPPPVAETKFHVLTDET